MPYAIVSAYFLMRRPALVMHINRDQTGYIKSVKTRMEEKSIMEQENNKHALAMEALQATASTPRAGSLEKGCVELG